MNQSLENEQNNKVATCDDFQLVKKLGSGGYGQVFLAKKLDVPYKNEPFALKIISKAKLLNKNRDKKYAKIERDILSNINRHPCPFLVSLYYAFDNEDYIFFCLEYLSGGELFLQLERQVCLTETECRFYSAEVITGIAHLHQLGIVYRDVKSENIMLDKHGHVKLTDFGLSKFIGITKVTRTFCGTLEFMAPELMARKDYSFEIDWWSMGILIHDMLVGGSPFASEDKENIKKKVLRGTFKLPSDLSNSAKSLIKRFLVANPQERLGARGIDEIQRHRFFRGLNWDKLYQRKITPPFVPNMETDFDVSLFDPKVVEQSLELTVVDYVNRDPNAFLDFTYVAPFATEIHLTETWMLCEESTDECSESEEMEMDIELIGISHL